VPNTSLQRTRAPRSARGRLPLSFRPLGGGSLSRLLGSALVVGVVLLPPLALAQTPGRSEGDPFRGVMAVESNSAPRGSVVRMEWTPIQLSRKNVDTLRRVLRSARARGLAEETEGRKTKQVSGGVPGCVSQDFRVTFGGGDRAWSGILHLSCGWFQAEEKDLGVAIVFSNREEASLKSALGSGS